MPAECSALEILHHMLGLLLPSFRRRTSPPKKKFRRTPALAVVCRADIDAPLVPSPGSLQVVEESLPVLPESRKQKRILTLQGLSSGWSVALGFRPLQDVRLPITDMCWKTQDIISKQLRSVEV